VLYSLTSLTIFDNPISAIDDIIRYITTILTIMWKNTIKCKLCKINRIDIFISLWSTFKLIILKNMCQINHLDHVLSILLRPLIVFYHFLFFLYLFWRKLIFFSFHIILIICMNNMCQITLKLLNKLWAFHIQKLFWHFF
jgi:hypothetical protein